VFHLFHVLFFCFLGDLDSYSTFASFSYSGRHSFIGLGLDSTQSTRCSINSPPLPLNRASRCFAIFDVQILANLAACSILSFILSAARIGSPDHLLDKLISLRLPRQLFYFWHRWPRRLLLVVLIAPPETFPLNPGFHRLNLLDFSEGMKSAISNQLSSIQ
jgi:hypothetical protein